MSEQEKYMEPILAGDELDALRKDSLAGMLQVARRRRWTRRISAACATACMIAAGAWLLMPHSGSTIPDDLAPRVTSATPHAQSIKRISDAELLALFPGQTLALIGPPGNQRLLILSEAPASN